MIIKKGNFYFIKNEFFTKVKDNELMKNKDNGKKRPCFYCLEDAKIKDLFWFVPISSKVNKYKKIYNYKIEKQSIKTKKTVVDTIVFGNLNNEEKVFLIQNMFPIIPKYIDETYCRKNEPVRISYELEKEIQSKVNKIFKLVRKGNKGLVFPDIIKIKNIMIAELKSDKMKNNE